MKNWIAGMTIAGLALFNLVGSGEPSFAEDVHVGIIMPTTGVYAFVGVAATNGANLAADYLNATNFFGLDKLKVVFGDDASNPNQAVTLLHQMAIRDNVLIVIGPASTSEAMVAGAAAADLKVAVFTTALSPTLFQTGAWIFRSSLKAERGSEPIVAYAADTLKVKKCFSVTIRDNEGYVRQKDIYKSLLSKRGIESVGDESVLGSESDFGALVTKIVYADPDCLILVTPPEQGANIIIQAKQAGLKSSVKIIGNISFSSPNLVKTGGKAVDGVYVPAQFIPSGVNGMAKKFVADYQKQFGSFPNDFAASGFSMMLVVADAIKRASPNPTPDKVREAMMTTKDVPVVLGDGKFSIDPDREPNFNAGIVVVHDGQFVQP